MKQEDARARDAARRLAPRGGCCGGHAPKKTEETENKAAAEQPSAPGELR